MAGQVVPVAYLALLAWAVRFALRDTPAAKRRRGIMPADRAKVAAFIASRSASS